MPLYECLTTSGTLNDDARQALAGEITTIHCEETGGPRDFVNVFFPELPIGHTFVAGRLAPQAVIKGSIRAGRSEEMRKRIIRRIFDAYQAITGQDVMRIVVVVEDVPAQWVMEGGMTLPEPTPAAEAAWFAELEAKQGNSRG